MKFTGMIFMENDLESPKMEVRGPTRQPEGCLEWPPLLAAPGTLLDAWWPPSVPPFAYKTPRVQTLDIEEFSCFAAATGRKPTEEKSHLRRADSTGEITSRKGRSSPSSSSSSLASSRSSSTSSPTSAPSPSPSHLISQLKLVL